MRVVRRDDFISLPEGVMFCKGCQWFFGNLMVKGESIGSYDWFEMDFLWPDSEMGEDAIDKLEYSLLNGSSFDIDKSYSRDGCFNDSDIFMILEKEDLLSLRDIIDKSLEIYDSS